MNNYLSEVEKILQSSDKSVDSVAIINADGIIEYARRSPHDIDLMPFHKKIVGKHLLEAYPGLLEEKSTVMKTLKTGQITETDRQILIGGDIEVTISSITYPLFDDDKKIQGAIDVVSVLDYKDNSIIDRDDNTPTLDIIITKDPVMLKIKDSIRNVAKNDSAVFVYGETGTGKELIAQAVHLLSPRKDRPFISQNCAAIPETLLESTFFGTEKGGFTGAETKPGLFEMADGGTLFLDEINSMKPSMQAKLLKVLEEQSVRRVGGERNVYFDVRIVCASNEKAFNLLRDQKLRDDFYYRISIVKVDLPPLRDRQEDILLLAGHFIQYYNDKMNKHIKGLSRMVQDVFCKWHWPGNVRELKGVIESAFNLENDDLITLFTITDLLSRMEEYESQEQVAPEGKRCSAKECEIDFSISAVREQLKFGKIDLKELLEEYERSIIKEALYQHRKLNTVAEQLSISPQKLSYRISKLDLK